MNHALVEIMALSYTWNEHNGIHVVQTTLIQSYGPPLNLCY